MTKTNITGILSGLSLISLLIIAYMISDGIHMISSAYFKAGIFNFAFMLAATGSFLIFRFGSSSWKNSMITLVASSVYAVTAYLIAFNLISFVGAWNWLIALTVLYLLYVELSLLQWRSQTKRLAKILGIILIATHGFLVLFFLMLWDSSALSIWIDLIILLSVVSFVAGLFLSKSGLPEEN